MQKSITIDKNKCIHCGKCGCQHCMATCPVDALSFGGKNPAESELVDNWNGDDLLKLIK